MSVATNVFDEILVGVVEVFFDHYVNVLPSSVLKANRSIMFDKGGAETTLREVMEEFSLGELTVKKGCDVMMERVLYDISNTLYHTILKDDVQAGLNTLVGLDVDGDMSKIVDAINGTIFIGSVTEELLGNMQQESIIDQVKMVGKLLFVREYLVEAKYSSDLVQLYDHTQGRIIDAIGLSKLPQEDAEDLVTNASILFEAYCSSWGIDDNITTVAEHFESILKERGYDERLGLRLLILNVTCNFIKIANKVYSAVKEGLSMRVLREKLSEQVTKFPILLHAMSSFDNWTSKCKGHRFTESVEWLEHLFLFTGGRVDLGKMIYTLGSTKMLFDVCDEIIKDIQKAN